MATPVVPWLYFLNSADMTLSQDLVAYYTFAGGGLSDTSGQGNNAAIQGGVTTTTGRLGDANSAYTFNGTTGFMSTTNSINSPQTYSANVWFKIPSGGTGGVLVAFTNAQTGTSESNYDRILWVDTTGHVNFGVWTGTATYITSTGTYNDGNWHMATSTMSTTTGMALYVDGVSVATNANTSSQVYTGWWRLGQSATASWPASMKSFYTGTMDEVRIYSVALNATQVSELYLL
jgi:hypothetical protein